MSRLWILSSLSLTVTTFFQRVFLGWWPCSNPDKEFECIVYTFWFRQQHKEANWLFFVEVIKMFKCCKFNRFRGRFVLEEYLNCFCWVLYFLWFHPRDRIVDQKLKFQKISFCNNQANPFSLCYLMCWDR